MSRPEPSCLKQLSIRSTDMRGSLCACKKPFGTPVGKGRLPFCNQPHFFGTEEAPISMQSILLVHLSCVSIRKRRGLRPSVVSPADEKPGELATPPLLPPLSSGRGSAWKSTPRLYLGSSVRKPRSGQPAPRPAMQRASGKCVAAGRPQPRQTRHACRRSLPAGTPSMLRSI